MSKSCSLPTKPEGVIPSLIERFKRGHLTCESLLQERRDSSVPQLYGN